MLLRSCLTLNPVTVSSGDTLETADARTKAGGFRRLPVVDDQVLVGILSEYDLRDRRDCLDRVAVRAAMTRELVKVSPHDTLEHAVSVTRAAKVGALLVVEHGHLVGILTVRDL
jgi:acetoin utilization protein AcuB